MPDPTPLRSLASLALAALAGCASSGGAVPEKGAIARPPQAPNGFVANAAAEGVVIAEARFFTNHEAIFGEDLIAEEGVIPIALRIGLPSKTDEQQDVQLTPDQMNFRLYLQDGTVLLAAPPEEVAKDEDKIAARVGQKKLEHGFLKLSGGMKEGFVYFKLKPSDAFELDGGALLHTVGAVTRRLDIARSLVSFQLTRGGQVFPFFIGLSRETASK